MNSAEYYQERSVHVLHHEFMPSGHLAAALRGFLTEEYQSIPLEIHSTKRVVLDSEQVFSGELFSTIHRAREYYRNFEAPIYLDGRVTVQEVEGQSRIAFLPRDQKLFNTLSAQLDILPDVAPQPKEVPHYLYVNVAKQALINNTQQRREVTESFAQRVTDRQEGRLHTVDRVPSNRLELEHTKMQLPMAVRREMSKPDHLSEAS